MNVKPGILAIITKCSIAGNTGKIVKVEKLCDTNEVGREGIWWVIISEGSPLALKDGRKAMRGWAHDSWLKPVEGLPDKESHKAVLEHLNSLIQEFKKLTPSK